MAVKNKISVFLLAMVIAGWAGIMPAPLFAQDELDSDPGYIDFASMEEAVPKIL